MKPRIDFKSVSPAAMRAMMGLQAYVNDAGLEPSLLDAWREAPIYSARVDELVSLTLAVVAINGWNRINVAFRNVPGNYRAARRTVSA